MEITLEQIELVKDRTGVSYKEAKEALEFANGNVVDAIIYIEENINNDYSNKKGAVDNVIKTVKDILHQGGVTRIKIYKNEELLVNVPVTVGVVASIAFPWGVLTAALASAAVKCRIEIIKDDGSVINVNEQAGNVVDVVKNKGGVIVDELLAKGTEIYNSAVEKGAEIYENTKDKVSEFFEESQEEPCKNDSEENCDCGDDSLCTDDIENN